LIDWGRSRRLTAADVKLLCSFPADFEMAGTDRQEWARLGNAVPPLMARVWALRLSAEPCAGGTEAVADMLLFHDE
jgi:site-specific DNA-cytosine methylase